MRSGLVNVTRLVSAQERVCLIKRLAAVYPARILTPTVTGRQKRFQSTSAAAAGKAEVVPAVFRKLDTYERRHVGSLDNDVHSMLKQVGVTSIDDFISQVIPRDILNEGDLDIDPVNGYTESDLLSRLSEIASENKILRNYIGTGYYGTLVPAVIQRNILECPEWYTSYTPYQPEISQGRLESLLNYQTLVSDLTGMDVANCSLLDEGTAAAEAMILSFNAAKGKRNVFYLDPLLHPQTIACVESRAAPLGIKTVVGLPTEADKDSLCGVLVQYPGTDGSITDWTQLAKDVHTWGGLVSVATDLLALTILEPPSKFGADICLGSSQRFGVSLGYGGPHAAFFAVTDPFKRKMPGRLVGKSKDRLGDDAYRLALQTREQHIRREKATSNICTAQALLANMAAMYAVYHGPHGLRDIATRVHKLTSILALGLEKLGYEIVNRTWFDTLTVRTSDASYIIDKAVKEKGINFRKSSITDIGISLDETVTQDDLVDILSVFATNEDRVSYDFLYSLSGDENVQVRIPNELNRSSQAILDYPVFNSYHSETEILRYMHHLQSKDLSLANSMIPLGSCTMKLNATTVMIPVTWKGFAQLHPFAPVDQAAGYQILLKELEEDLASICGLDAASLQPNSGAQGEYTGLRTIRAYLESIGQSHRNICLIPVSAHGTNPASATMAGLKVVAIKCTSTGELDLEDLEAKADKHKDNLAAIMITYPSTFGVFEPGVKRAIEIVHGHGGQVYMDGANMNAQIGLTSPGFIGADVCHLNLHKTFCIPHGGGGPGMGPICVRSHLKPFLPSHPLVASNPSPEAILPVSAAPWGSASILPISWAYIKMMGSRGLTKATKMAILNANYMANKLSSHYKVLYTNQAGRCAHEFILDMRGFKKSAGIEAIDIAKRLQDYGFHAPTMSWPVANTLMIEPTESESLGELDRFCNALISIRKEIKDIEDGKQPKENNLLTNAPHSHKDLLREDWDRPYTRTQAAFPIPYLETRKFWPSVTRLDDSYGDTHLFCSCEPPSLTE